MVLGVLGERLHDVVDGGGGLNGHVHGRHGTQQRLELEAETQRWERALEESAARGGGEAWVGEEREQLDLAARDGVRLARVGVGVGVGAGAGAGAGVGVGVGVGGGFWVWVWFWVWVGAEKGVGLVVQLAEGRPRDDEALALEAVDAARRE